MDDQAQLATETDIGGEAPAATPAPELSISDLQNLRAIVDTAARRGAFQAAEMSAIGAVFDRVNAFLNAVAPAAPAQTEESVPAEAVAEEVAE
jgi:hypothetical protein